MTKPTTLLLLIMICSPSYALELEPADSRNAEAARYACDKLGHLCIRLRAECSPSKTSMPNTCLAIEYFRLEVAKERCGAKRYLECYEENREYMRRWMNELNIPNIGNPKRQTAFEQCENTGKYSPKSEQLRKFANRVYDVFRHIREPIDGLEAPYYRDERAFYECFRSHFE